MLKREDLKVGETYQSKYTAHAKSTILSIGETKLFFEWDNGINRGESVVDIATFMENNELIKPEPRIEILYECMEENGTLVLYFEDGHFPRFGIKEKSLTTKPETVSRKTGRTFRLNMDTWELVDE